MARQRTKSNELTTPYQTAIQQRDAAAKVAPIDMAKLTHELCVFLSKSISSALTSKNHQATFLICLISLKRTQEMISFVQENEGSNVTASLTIGQARVEPITSSLPKGGRRLHAECGRRPHAHWTEHRFAESNSSKRNPCRDVAATSNFSSKGTHNPS